MTPMSEGSQPDKPSDPCVHLPLTAQEFQLLLVVFQEPMHGYGIVKASTDEAGNSVLDLGSLYRIIGRLARKGLINEVTVDQVESKRPRRYYRATKLGRRVARAEALRLRGLLESERAKLLWQEP